jgi:predicted MFS family arabinose efflux permease
MLCNIGMAFAGSFGMMLVLWGVNGCFQSMFWSTIIRVLAQNISADKRATISAGISLAMPAAYIVSWGLLGQLLDGAQVKWYFTVPALVCVPLIAVWMILSGKLNFEVQKKAAGKAGIAETVKFVASEKLHWMILVCMFHGLIKEGAAYWTPLLVSGMEITKTWSPFLLVCILPVANLVGILASRVLMKNSSKNPYQLLMLLFGAIVLLSAGLQGREGMTAAMIIGGVGRFGTCVAGGLILGLLQSLVVFQFASNWQNAITFLVLLIFLFFRPQGIAGYKQRTV